MLAPMLAGVRVVSHWFPLAGRVNVLESPPPSH
jgi:hypothetical protein